MKKIIIVIAIFCSGAGFVSAQASKQKNHTFYSVNSVGMLNGSNGTALAVQTVNGIGKKNWFAGIGLGLDFYQYRTIPLFADARYEFGQKKNKVFLYADAGINFNWVQGYFYEKPGIWDGSRVNDFYNGFYSDAGIGFSVALKKGQAFILSAGYSRKTLMEKYTYTDWRAGDRWTDVNTYRFNRIVLKSGFRF